MIITKNYAKRLIRRGKARVNGHTTTANSWPERSNGRTYAIISRPDLQRVDHVEVMDLWPN